MTEFERAYKQLNAQQKKAVDKIDGPVLVIAGPGTGKTELLALRAAQILRQDSTMLPSNILCLTFTNSAANNLRERLIQYIGQDAYQVAIHTFNSFGSYIMNARPEYFYEWRETQTADELTTHNILAKILTDLPGDHLLAGRGMDGSFFAQTQVRNLIGDAKRADLKPKELKLVLSENRQAYETLRPFFHKLWPKRMSDKTATSSIAKLYAKLVKLPPAKSQLEAVVPLQNVIIDSLAEATEQAEAQERGKTKTFTAWKEQWLEKDEVGQWVFKAEKYLEKMFAAADIYEKYQAELEARGLADFNDQIMRVIEAMQKHNELRYNLQERFNYLMIDEFQDTNRSQLLLARYLTDAPVHEGHPNILAVGDDDQAIFRFQGADIGNVGLFEALYQKPLEITLDVNYRSSQPILSSSRQVSQQIELSLEKQKGVNKQLLATVKKTGEGVRLNEHEHEGQHYSFVAQEIKKQLKEGLPGQQIAVLARERMQLDALVPYLREQKIALNYERRENVLQQQHIINLLTMARLVYHLQQNRLDAANELFAQILIQPMWQLKPTEIWELASEAYRSGQLWMDVISDRGSEKCQAIVEFFIRLGFGAKTMPLEQITDELIGTGGSDAEDEQADGGKPEPDKSFFSPFKRYFFSQEILSNQPSEYLTLLSHLATLRRHLKNYQTDIRQTLYLKDLIELADSYERAGMNMLDTAPHNEDSNAVWLMTIHKVKGLEFDSVFIIGLQNSVWTRATSRGRFSYPANLKAIKPSDNQDDDGLRLLFVAMTRAKQNLSLNYFRIGEDGAPTHPYAPLLAIEHQPVRPTAKDSPAVITRQYERRWLAPIQGSRQVDKQAFFVDQLAKYQLSATHLNNFLDVSMGGPMYFFNQNLVHFPAAKTPPGIYGSLIHAALKRAHTDVIAGKKLRPDHIVDAYKRDLRREALSSSDKQRYLTRGEKVLRNFLSLEPHNFTPSQVVEYDFKDQGVTMGNARLRGFIDLMEKDTKNKTVAVIDYKTGPSYTRWSVSVSAEEYRKIRLRAYRRQLLFYKLLIDGSSDWGRRGWKAQKGLLRFVEPDRGKIRSLELVYETDEIGTIKKLVAAVWGRIQSLDFPDTSTYPPTLAGIIQFEQDLTHS